MEQNLGKNYLIYSFYTSCFRFYRGDNSNTKLRFAQLNIYAQRYCNQSYITGGRIGERIDASLPKKFQPDLLCAGFRVRFL